MGPEAAANGLGGTLMNETITRSAGAVHGQEMAPQRMAALIAGLGRTPRQRTTLYGPVAAERRTASLVAPPLAPARQTPPARRREPARPRVA